MQQQPMEQGPSAATPTPGLITAAAAIAGLPAEQVMPAGPAKVMLLVLPQHQHMVSNTALQLHHSADQVLLLPVSSPLPEPQHSMQLVAAVAAMGPRHTAASAAGVAVHSSRAGGTAGNRIACSTSKIHAAASSTCSSEFVAASAAGGG
jgi:hypothetical protein